MRRSRRHFSALVALAAFVASFALPFVAPRHAWIVDLDAGWDVPVLAGAPAFTTPTDARDGEHCAICHWMRALGSSLVGATMRRLAFASPPRIPAAPVAMPRTFFAFDRPARAPPASIA
jgi:hypothetical protein